jgi:YegS/Rv2252/BmrU family lipid kinase
MAPRNALIIVNPASNHGEAAKLWPVAADLLENLFPHQFAITEAPSHASALAADATDFDTVVAMGGDGTVHEILNGLMRIPDDRRPALTVLPVGSGNDYARTLGIAFDLARAAFQIASGRRVRVDVGTCNGRYFANTLAVGLDAQVTAKSVELKATTGRTGLPLYLSALIDVLRKEYRSYDALLGTDGEEPRRVRLLLAAFTHGPTYGGGFHITPEAIGDDGLMDVCTIDAMPRWQAVWRVPFLIPGKHGWMGPVAFSRHRTVDLRSERPIPGQIDGEVLLEHAYEIGVEHLALTVIVPSEPS